MAQSDNILATGPSDPEAVGRIGSGRAFPGGLTQSEYIAANRPNIEALQDRQSPEYAARVDQLYEDGLVGTYNINNVLKEATGFSRDIIPSDVLDQVRSATRREKSGSQTPQDVQLLSEVRDPNGIYRRRFNRLIDGAPNLVMGVQTGTFPLDPISGGAIIPESSDTETNVIDVESRIDRKAAESQRLLGFVEQHPQQPLDPNVREALYEVLDMQWQDVFVDRVQGLGRFGGMAGFHLGYFLKNTFTDEEGNVRFDLHGNPKDRAIAFEKYRTSDAWIDTRKEIIDNMIREQMRFRLGDEEFNRRGYGEKVTNEDGDEVFKVQFVTDQFAEDVSEFMFDQLSWREQLLTVVGEGAVAYNAVKWPFKGVMAAQRRVRLGIAAQQDKLVALGRKTAGQNVLPSADAFRLLPRDRQRALAETVAATRGISVEEAARNLATRSKDAGWWHTFRAGTLAGAIAEQSSVRTMISQNEVAEDTINALRDSYRNTVRTSAKGSRSAEAIATRERLNMEIARANNRAVRAMMPTMRQFGINPMFDTAFGLAQISGRRYFNDPIGELYGVGLAFTTIATGKGISYVSRRYRPTQVVGGMAGGAINDLAFLAKSGVEEMATMGLKILTGFQLAEADGLARGFVKNPNLRYLTKLSDEQRKRLPFDVQRELDKFTKRLKGLPQSMQDMMVDNLSDAMDDIHTIVSTIPMKGSTPEITSRLQTARSNMEAALAVHLGEASGINLFFAMSKSAAANNDGVTAGGALSMNQEAMAILKKQQSADRRVQALSLAQQRIEREILNLQDIQSQALRTENVGLQTAIDRLTTLSESFKRASAFANAELTSMIANDSRLAAKELSMLADPANYDLAQESITSGYVENLISLVRNAEDRFLTSADNPNSLRIDQFEGESRFLPGETLQQQLPEQPITVESLREQARNADMLIRNFEANLINTAEGLRFSQDSVEIFNTQNKVLHGFVTTARAQSAAIVKDAYEQVPENLSINFSGFAVGIDKFLRAYATEYETSMTKMADPTMFEAFGGTHGNRLYNALNSGSRRGMIAFFDENLEVFNEAVEGGGNFKTGTDVLDYFKNQYYGSREKGFLIEKFGEASAENPNRITDLQIALQILEDSRAGLLPEGMSFESFNFAVSAKELEELRQGANYLRGATKPGTDRHNIAMLIINNVDRTFDEWGQGVNVDNYNAVVRARVIARAEAQRYDRGTIADAIERIHAVNKFKTLGGNTDDEIFDITTKSESDLLAPLVNAILKGDEGSTEIIEREMRRLRSSFAPISGELPENILVRMDDGKFRMPTDQEISRMTTAVMGEEEFTRLSAIVNAQVQAELLKTGGLKTIDQAVKNNSVPNIIGENLPQPLQIPAQYEGNLLRFLEDVDSRSVVMVMNPKTGVPEPRQLIKSFDIFQASADVTAVVNSSKKFQSVHAELVQDANFYVAQNKEILDATAERAAQITKAITGVGENTAGDKFFTKYIASGDETSVRQIIALTRDSEFLARGNFTEREVQQGLQGIVAHVIRSVGEIEPPRDRTVQMFDGTSVAVETYGRPDRAFDLINDALSGRTIEGRNFRELTDAAGVSEDQLLTLRAIFRFATRMEGERLYSQMDASGRPTLKQATKGFNLDNALSRAFNLARGMVGVQFVAAEVALRYAALSSGASMKVILTDERAARIVKDTLTDVDAVTEDDARYLADTVFRVSAITTADMLKEIEKQDPDFADYARNYWENVGVLTPSGDREGELVAFP